eukprot:3895643-Pleurochrysis_carterae.AAC.1
MPPSRASLTSTERASSPWLRRSSERMAPLNSPATSAVGAAWQQARRRRMSWRERKGKSKEAGSLWAAALGADGGRMRHC